MSLRLLWKSSTYCHYYKVVAQWILMGLNLFFFPENNLTKDKHLICCWPTNSWTLWSQNEYLVLLMVTECNMLDNNPDSFFLTNSNRNLKYQDAQVLSELKICFISQVGGHCSEEFCNLEMKGLEWLWEYINLITLDITIRIFSSGTKSFWTISY